MTEDFERAIRDDLVRVHVRGRARAALEHVDDELIVQLALANLVARLADRSALRHRARRVRCSPARRLFSR
jgi:hypothetical protein